MYATFLLAALVQVPGADPDRPSLVIFGRERWYQAVKGDEEVFTGVLERLPGGGRNQRNSFVLVMRGDVRNPSREVFVGEDTRALLPFVNRRVRITGMAVDLRVDSRMRYEIWPARIELEGRGVGGGRPGQILARLDWQARLPPGGVVRLGAGQQQAAIRSGVEFFKAVNGNREEAREIVRGLGVDDIDWRTQMVLVVTGGVQQSTGYAVEITNIDIKNQTMTVSWRLQRPGPRDPMILKPSHPAQIVVVPRFEGNVRFDPPAPK